MCVVIFDSTMVATRVTTTTGATRAILLHRRMAACRRMVWDQDTEDSTLVTGRCLLLFPRNLYVMFLYLECFDLFIMAGFSVDKNFALAIPVISLLDSTAQYKVDSLLTRVLGSTSVTAWL